MLISGGGLFFEAGHHSPIAIRLAGVELSVSPANARALAVEAGCAHVPPHQIVAKPAIDEQSALRQHAAAEVTFFDVVGIRALVRVHFVRVYD